MATPQTPQTPSRGSVLKRYTPFIAVIVVLAVVVLVIALVSGGDDDNGGSVSTNTDANGSTGATDFSDVPIFYNEAKEKGTLDDYTWQDNCDTETGEVAIPILNPPPCVPAAEGDNGGETSPGVTADTIKIGIYSAKPDPVYDPILKAAGAYDTPDATYQGYKDYIDLYSNVYETYGRKIELVRITGTGGSTDEVAAKADADKFADAGVFAVLGGPAQARSFQAELASNKILCVGGCVLASPEKLLAQYSPYLWTAGGDPEGSSDTTTEWISKQLAGKKAEFGGDDVKDKDRTFALLSYDTPDGEYKESWDRFYNLLKDADVPMVGHVSYFLNPASLAADGRTIANKLKATGATSIIFTGDPIFPSFLTPQMTQQGYFPEWVMSGTVLADTVVFARKFDQEQWKHAFGLLAIPARVEKSQQDAYTLHQWYFGTPPPTENNFALLKGYTELLMTGIQLAGPKLTPETFRDGMYHLPPQTQGPKGLNTIVTWGDHGFREGTDYSGLDNAGLLYWDPNDEGPDETGNEGKGMYRMVDGGKRYLLGQWPTEPIKMFDKASSVSIYEGSDVPAELLPKEQPVPAGAPAAK